jgi:hypothetical protein
MDINQLKDRLRRAEQYKPMLDRAQELALSLSKLLDKRDEELQSINRSKKIVHLTPLILDKERREIRIDVLKKVHRLIRTWKSNPAKLESVIKDMIEYEQVNGEQ